ncbi:MAG: adenylate/guanylate cyclase domain-containing protein [Thermodesulfobacteriota bacterium]
MVISRKDKLNNIKWEKYSDSQEFRENVEKIVQIAIEEADAEVGVLFLTPDGFFLEAAHWERVTHEAPPKPPASELPEYRLNWNEKDPKKLDGITAYVAIHQKVENLNQDEVFEHPAWKGKWDAVFLEGDRKKCKGILAIPVKRKIEKGKGIARVHGVLKVENPKRATTYGRFKEEHVKALEKLADTIATKLDQFPNFWCKFVQTRADIKVSYLVELMGRGRSIRYNISQGLNYVIKLFSCWLECQTGVHLFWHYWKTPECHILKPWDFAAGEHENNHTALDRSNAAKLVVWLRKWIGPKIVQPGLPIDDELWDFLFPGIPYKPLVDIIRLKKGRYDLGVLIFPRSPLWESDNGSIDALPSDDMQILEILTRLTMNVVSILGRFIEDKYDTTGERYLPKYRLGRARKTCAFMFVDIRNFSQLIQILRMMREPQLIEPFMNRYCERIGEIIGTSPIGRVDKFLGDGVIAIFGEDLDDPTENYKKIVVAVKCAFDMITMFEEIYKGWVKIGIDKISKQYHNADLEKGSIETSKYERFHDLRNIFNEDVQIDLAIGINMGEVFFDYFGHGNYREYTAIGDHVNFTQRLEGAAGRFDEKERRKRGNILISQTAYYHLYENDYLLNKKEPIWLSFEGFGFVYPVYELEYTDLNHEKIANTIKELERMLRNKREARA